MSLFGISKKSSLYYDNSYNDGPFAIFWHVAYATLGSTLTRPYLSKENRQLLNRGEFKIPGFAELSLQNPKNQIPISD